MRTLYLFLIALNLFVFNSLSQNNLATVGKEFWIGFMNNADINSSDQLKVFITSTFNTTGTLSIPTTGYSQNFTVTANQTTEVIVPNNLAEHYTSNVIENKGILIETLKDVSVFYLNSQSATSDGAKILPIQSLGTNYRTMAAIGLSSSYASELLIVATENNTQVEITPSVNTQGGFNANIPYTINLNRGQSYQVKAVGAADLTGSTVKATAASGSCRPFAVFSGSQCTNIPAGCTYCDHVCDQNVPVEAWEKEFLVVPFSGPTQYYVRALAHENNSVITRNGVVVATLNAGQYWSQVNTATTPLYISSNKNISVAEFMSGNDCSGNVGDPAMLLLNSSSQFINNVTFTTPQSTLITLHRLNIISKTPFTNQVSLDGALLNPTVFTPIQANPYYSYAQITLAAGSHTINAPNGIQGYVYGFGNSTYETYAYSLGSSVSQTEINVDTVLCSNDTVTIGNNESLFSTWWSSMSNPTDTLLTGSNYYSILPISPEIYILHGNQLISGCPIEYLFNVETGTPASVNITASMDTTCLYQPVQLNATVNPPGNYIYSWTPSIGLSDPTIPNPIASLPFTVEYTLQVTSIGGCSNGTDSVTIAVQPGSVTKFEVEPEDVTLCLGDTTNLQVFIEAISASEQFDAATFGSMIGVNQGVSLSNTCVSTIGNALSFSGTGTRSIETIPMNVVAGGTLKFSIYSADMNSSCNATEFGDNMVLEYSINGGAAWTTVQTYFEFLYHNWTEINIPIPALAQTSNTIFRWRQVLHEGLNLDIWLLDNVFVSTVQTSGYTVNWSPATNLQVNNQGLNADVFPANTTTYIASFLDPNSGCFYTDSVHVVVAPAFDLSTVPLINLCELGGVSLTATETSSTPVTFAWTPSATLSDSSLQNPVANPLSTTTYIVNAVSQEGCSRTDSVKVFINPIHTFNVSPNSATICLSDSVVSSLAYSLETCSLTGSSCGLTQTVVVGTGTSLSASTSVTPFPSYASSKRQYLITQAELSALGLNGINNLQSLALNIGSVGGTGIYQNFTIKIGCTSINSLGVQYVPNLLVAKSPSTITLTSGWNTFNFDQSFVWDGISNIVVELCYSNPSSITASAVYNSIVSSGVIYSTGTSVCNNVSGSNNSNRPNMTFGYCTPDTNNNLIYAWSPNYNISATNIANPVFTPQVSTTYYVIATDTVSGCIYDDSVTINVAPAFDLTTIPEINLCEIGGVGLTANENSISPVSFTWSPSSTLSSSTAQNPIANPSFTTTYYVNAVNQEGCSRSDSVKVVINPLYALDVNPDSTTICMNDSLQSVLNFTPETCLLSGNSCSSTQTVQIGFGTLSSTSSGTTPFTTSASSKRQYLITQAELAALGLIGVNNLQSLALNVASVGGTGIFQNFTVKIGCTSATTLSTQYIPNLYVVKSPSSITLTSGWNTFNFDQSFVWDGVSNIVIELCYNNPSSGSSSGVYYASALGSGIYNVGASVCNNTTGTMTSNRPNMRLGHCTPAPNNNLIYSWSPNYNISATNVANPIFTPFVNTTYYVLATDTVSGCQYSDSIRIYVNSATDSINVNAGPDQQFCNTSNHQLSVGSPFTNPIYSWSPANLLNNAAIQNPVLLYDTTVTFVVLVHDVQNCGTWGSDTVTITSLGYPDINAGADLTICSGDSTQLNAISNANDFLWTNGSSLSDSTAGQPWASPLNSTTYTVTVTDTNNCSASDTIQVFVDIVPVINQASDTVFICPGDSILLNAGSGFTNYLWSNNSTQQSISVNIPGIYWVETLNACDNARDTIVVVMLVAPNVNLGNDTTICLGSNIQLDAGFISGASYSWSNSLNTQTITVGYQNQYWVNVIDSNNCFGSDTIAISISNPVLNLGNDTTICSGNTLTLSSLLYESYDWSTGDSTQTITVDSSGVYSVIVTDSIGCNASDQLILTVSDLPVFTLGNDTSACEGEFITLTTNSSLSSSWSTGDEDVQSISVNTDGIYWATLTNSDQCSYTDSINITFNSLPVLDLGDDLLLCLGDSIQLNALSNAQQISWLNSSTMSDSTSFQPWAAPTVETTYYAVVLDSNNCSAADTLQINMTDVNSISLGIDTAIFCAGDSVVLDAGNTLDNYLWSDNSTGQTLTVNSSSIIWVETSNICGPSRDSVVVIVNPLPQLTLPNEVNVCSGDSIQLNAVTNGSSVSWSNSSTLSNANIAQPWASPDTTTVYEITVADLNGCVNTQSIMVNVLYYPNVEFEYDSLYLCQGTSIMLDAGPGFDTYLWQDNSTDQTYNVIEAGVYWASATNNGCGTDSDTVIVELDDCDCHLYIPNSFTPGIDKVNSHFYPVSNCDFAELTFTIFNRWGEKIFETSEISNPWDGTYKGEKVQDGVYTYLIVYRFKDDVTLSTNGSVTVIR